MAPFLNPFWGSCLRLIPRSCCGDILHFVDRGTLGQFWRSRSRFHAASSPDLASFGAVYYPTRAFKRHIISCVEAPWHKFIKYLGTGCTGSFRFFCAAFSMFPSAIPTSDMRLRVPFVVRRTPLPRTLPRVSRPFRRRPLVFWGMSYYPVRAFEHCMLHHSSCRGCGDVPRFVGGETFRQVCECFGTACTTCLFSRALSLTRALPSFEPPSS